MKVVEHTYPIFVLCVIYLICICRDTRKTNDLQDAAQEEFNKSLSFLMESINNLNNKIEESEITEKHQVDEKDDDQHKVSREDLVNNYEMKENKSDPTNIGSIDHDGSLIPTYQYRKIFDAINRVKNRKDTMKEIWTKQEISLRSRKAIVKSQDPALNKIQDLQKEIKELYRYVDSRKLQDNDKTTTTTSSCNCCCDTSNTKEERDPYPSVFPSSVPSLYPSIQPSVFPSSVPSIYPTVFPSDQPSIFPSKSPSIFPSLFPSMSPSVAISSTPSFYPTEPFDVNVDTSTHYPQSQCKNEVCICDSYPSLIENFSEKGVLYQIKVQSFLLEISMFSDSDKLRSVESAQYKAACWVLYDDPYGYNFSEKGIHKQMIQRYILAVLYFTSSPEKWSNHQGFLTSYPECSWNGIDCDEDDNAIEINLSNNNIHGMIVEELSGLRMLEVINLRENNIQGNIPPVLGRLSELRVLDLGENDLEGTMPEMVGNFYKLSSLSFDGNNLSGSIPHDTYTSKHLKRLNLSGNKISSSISPLIGNLNELELLELNDNMLTGEIPSTIGSLSLLERLYLENNTLSGPIPESLFKISSLRNLKLQNNAVSGTIPDQLCEIDGLDLQADCQNDIFEPQVSCSCCSVCIDKTPIWDGECADSTIKIEIDRRPIEHDEYSYSSDELEWSLMNAATKKRIPFSAQDGFGGGTACVAFSDCISIDMISQPIFDTYFHIYWNNDHADIRKFPGSLELERMFEYKNTPFQIDEETQELITCRETELLTCDNGYESVKFIFDPKSPIHISFSKVTSLFGRQNILETSSPQSKALCWILQNEDSNDRLGLSDTEILERFVLTIVHVTSQNGLFGDNEYPPPSHECEWPGIQCSLINGTNIVTRISLSSEQGQIINGTLIEELGGLQYLETLELSQTQLSGTIPKTFSNLWSLKKLDLSENELTGTLPVNMFRQLDNLEHINLSNNLLSSNINEDIGSFSHISVLSMKNNSFTGSLPLEGFKYNDLEHLDVSGNQLNSVEFDHLIKHTKLKSLDLSFNFFVGSLHENTFTSLSRVEYMNISQNDFSGTIPLTFPELSNITHFDAHANRLQGTIPRSISVLSKAQYINLQGNKLTGSLPSELNQLKNLNTLVLSHNELKGSIPFDPNILQNINRLHLQSNKLSGQAPIFSNMTSYITDCGFPSDSLDPVSCTSCNTCCNSGGVCQSKSSEKLSQMHSSLIFMFTIITFIMICYALKDHITSNRYLESFFVNTVSYWNALMLISDKSVYHFLLLENKICWYVAFLCGIFQSLTLFLFVHSADILNETSDREYTMLCPSNSLECEDSIKISSYGIFIFSLILAIWLLRDIVGSVKLMLVSFQKRDIDFFFTSGFVFSVTMLSLWTSIIYIQAIAMKNTDMIKDAVVLLFVVGIDERLFQLIESLNPDWVQKVDRNMRDSLVYEGKDLVISSWMNKFSASFRSMRLGMRGRNETPSVKQQNNMDEEIEELEEMEKKDHVEVLDESNP